MEINLVDVAYDIIDKNVFLLLKENDEIFP